MNRLKNVSEIKALVYCSLLDTFHDLKLYSVDLPLAEMNLSKAFYDSYGEFMHEYVETNEDLFYRSMHCDRKVF